MLKTFIGNLIKGNSSGENSTHGVELFGALRLVVMEDEAVVEEKIFPVEGEYSVGRGEDCSFQCLRDGRLSRKHLSIAWHGTELTVTSLSNAGTFLGEERLVDKEPTVVPNRSHLRMTSTLYLYVEMLAQEHGTGQLPSQHETLDDERGGTMRMKAPAPTHDWQGTAAGEDYSGDVNLGDLHEEIERQKKGSKGSGENKPPSSDSNQGVEKPLTVPLRNSYESIPLAPDPLLSPQGQPSAPKATGKSGTVIVARPAADKSGPDSGSGAEVRLQGTLFYKKPDSGSSNDGVARPKMGDASDGPTFKDHGRKGKPVDPYVQLRQEIHTELHDELQKVRSHVEDLDLEQQVRNLISVVLKRRYAAKNPPKYEEAQVRKDVIEEMLGLGPIEDYMKDPAVTEIMVSGCEKIFVERQGKVARTEKSFPSDYVLMNVIDRIVTRAGRKIDQSSPMVDARLPDGSRVNAVFPPVAISGPALTIRKFRKSPFQLHELVARNSLDERMARFLERCVRARKNMIISGGTGTGKTSLLNTLSNFIDEHERLVTIEDAAELQLQQDHVVSLESRPGNIEGKGEIKIRDLLRNALRMRPDRIVVGECRGGEVLDMLQAMNTGHEGSLTTAHANTPEDLLNRIEIMVLQAVEMPVSAIRDMIGSTLDVVVQLTRMSDGRRIVTSISEVIGYDRQLDRIIIKDIFRFERSGISPSGQVLGEFRMTGHLPSFLHQFKLLGLLEDGQYL